MFVCHRNRDFHLSARNRGVGIGWWVRGETESPVVQTLT